MDKGSPVQETHAVCSMGWVGEQSQEYPLPSHVKSSSSFRQLCRSQCILCGLRSVDLTGGMSVNSIEKALALRSQQRLPSRIKMAPKALNLKPQDCRGMLGKSQVPHGGMRARESGNFAASASKVPWLLWSGHSQYHCHSEGGHYSHKMRALMSGRTVTGMSKTGLLTMKVLLV